MFTLTSTPGMDALIPKKGVAGGIRVSAESRVGPNPRSDLMAREAPSLPSISDQVSAFRSPLVSASPLKAKS